MRKIAINTIGLYQKITSPKLNPLSVGLVYSDCKYIPSCSEYAKQAIYKYGFLKGTTKSFLRILRCNPLASGGLDLP